MELFDTASFQLSDLCRRLVNDSKLSPGPAKYLNHMEATWRSFEPFASPNFRRNLLTDDSKFYSLTWEMILGIKLLESGYCLDPSPNDYRPDLCINRGGRRIWIECCLPTGGDPSKPNSVLPLVDGSHTIDLDKSVLRCTAALVEKKQQHKKWMEDSVCNQDEPFIIAIHGRNLHLNILESYLPHICRALYGVGDMYMIFDSKDLNYRESGYQSQTVIPKSEVANIPTTFFLDTTNNHVSGIIYSTDWFMRHSSSPQYCYVENVNAKNRTGPIFTEFCQTYEYKDNQIRLQNKTP